MTGTPNRGARIWSPGITLGGEMVALPFGLATVVVLTRVMGPEAYAPIAVALAVWSWATLTMNAVFGSTGVLLVAGAGDRWQAAASTLMALQVRVGLLCCVMLLLLAPLLSAWLRLPSVGVLLAILALDLPGFALASSQVSVLLARGALHARALVIVVFWLTRATLMIGAAVSGAGAIGVALAAPATSLAQLLVLRRFVHTALRVDMQVPPRTLAAQSVLFFSFSSVVALIDRLGLLVLRPSGVNTAAIGWYAAAQTAATAPSLLTMLVSGLLLAAISRERARGRDAEAATAARAGLAWLVWLIPVLAICAAGAPLIVRLAFGRAFEPAAPLLAWLCAAAWGMASIKISSAILAAHGHMKPIVAVAATTLTGCSVGYALFVPDGGALASAQVTAIVTCGGGTAAIALCARIGLRPGLRDMNARALGRLLSDTA